MKLSTARAVSLLAAGLATAAVFLFVVPTGCAAVDGVPSWEECTTVLGTPAFSLEDLGLDNTFDILLPIVVGLMVGLISWLGLAAQARDDA